MSPNKIDKYLVIGVFLFVSAVVIVSCNQGPKGNNSLRAIWESSDSTLQQRVDAANKLIAPGTSSEAVLTMLGTNGVWHYYHGPFVDLISNSPPHNASILVLEYQDSRGTIGLTFTNSPTGGEFSFVHAGAVITGTNVP